MIENIHMFTFGSLVKTLKKTASNTSQSDELFLNAIVDAINEACSELGTGCQPEIDKTRTSRLLNNKDEIPRAMKKPLEIDGFEYALEDAIGYFAETILDSKREETTKKNIAELINNGLPDENVQSYLLSDSENMTLFITRAIIESLKVNNKIDDRKYILWNNAENSISVIEGDIVKYGFAKRSKRKRIIVVPVETTFETHVSSQISQEQYPLISENTLHGKWIIAWQSSGQPVDVLKKQIAFSLNQQGLCEGKDVLKLGKSRKYPIGTIAVVEHNSAIFYLTAISELDEKNVAHSDAENIRLAIKKVLLMYNERGQGYPLYIPLVGTGRSRTGMTYQESLEFIRTTLLENKHLIYGNVNIVIQPNAIKELNIDEIKEKQK